MTPIEAKSKMLLISREKSKLIKKLQKSNVPNAYSNAGKTINDIYGKGWREKLEFDIGGDFGKMSYF